MICWTSCILLLLRYYRCSCSYYYYDDDDDDDDDCNESFFLVVVNNTHTILARVYKKRRRGSVCFSVVFVMGKEQTRKVSKSLTKGAYFFLKEEHFFESFLDPQISFARIL